MQADNEERYVEESQNRSLPLIPILVVVALAVAALAWYVLAPGKTELDTTPTPDITPVVPAQLPPPVVPAAPPEPDIPEPVETVVEPDPNTPIAPPEPELTLDASDPVVRKALLPELEGSSLAVALDNDDLLDRAAGLIDATSQGRVFHEVFKLPPPAGKFTVITEGENSYINPENYERYDAYAAAVGQLNPETVASAFHTFRPLLEQAYASLGYQADDLDNALIKALEQVATAPQLQHPAILEKDVTTWHYTDESLENLSPLAKQLLRMGPENQAIIQSQAIAIKKALLAP